MEERERLQQENVQGDQVNAQEAQTIAPINFKASVTANCDCRLVMPPAEAVLHPCPLPSIEYPAVNITRIHSVREMMPPTCSVEWTMRTRSCYMPWASVESKYFTYPLHMAAAAGDTATCRQLLKRRVDVQALDSEHNTPLIMAAAACLDQDDKVVRMLLDCFSDPGARAEYVKMTNKDGLTALHFAVLAARPSLVQLLLDAGADPNAGIYSKRDGEWLGLTPLHFSLSSMTNQSVKCRQYLLEAGADPNVEMAFCDNSYCPTLLFECDCGGCWSTDIMGFIQ
ncbi:hypothetical protein BaRGS_00014990, partial [Batillaria attramentaria]